MVHLTALLTPVGGTALNRRQLAEDEDAVFVPANVLDRLATEAR